MLLNLTAGTSSPPHFLLNDDADQGRRRLHGNHPYYHYYSPFNNVTTSSSDVIDVTDGNVTHQGGTTGAVPLGGGVEVGGDGLHPGGGAYFFYDHLHNLSTAAAGAAEDGAGGASSYVTTSLDTYYNESSSWFNVTPTGDPLAASGENQEGHYNWGVLSLSLLILATMVGNVLVCLAVCWEKRLQNMTNYFLMSLAIADLLVSMLVMPLGMVVEFFGYFPLNAPVCVMWATFDVLMCTASIWHMCTMSMDRYFTLKYPMKYGRNKTRTTVALKILFVWVISIAISSPVCVLGFLDYNNVYNKASGACVPTIRSFIIYGSMFAFCIPLCIMVVTYVMTIKILCDNQKLMKSIAKQQGDKKSRKERNGGYSMTYLTPNVYVPRDRFMERASIDTTLSGITINETSLQDTLSSPKDEAMNLATPLVPEPCGGWPQQQTTPGSTTDMEEHSLKQWEERNGQAVVGAASCQDPWAQASSARLGSKREERVQEEKEEEWKCVPTSVSAEAVGGSMSEQPIGGSRHELVGRTNSGFSAALDTGLSENFSMDDVVTPTSSSSSTVINSNSQALPGPLSHIPTQADFSSSQPHLPSAVSSPLSTIKTRSRLTSAPTSGRSVPSSSRENVEIHSGSRTSSSSQEHRSNLSGTQSRNGSNSLPDGQEASQCSSLTSMMSKGNWDSNATGINEHPGNIQEKLCMIEQEMDEYLRETLPGASTSIENNVGHLQDPFQAEVHHEVAESESESESDTDHEGCGDPAEQSLYKADSVDDSRQNGGHLVAHEIPPVLVSSPPNMSSDETQIDSDSEKSNLITIRLKASGCYLYQIEPDQASSPSRMGEEVAEAEKETQSHHQQAGHLLSMRQGDSTECSCDELDRDRDLELYCQNETEESMSESGHTKMIVRNVYPSRKKRRLNRFQGYTTRLHTFIRQKSRRKEPPICKVNGMVPTNVISKRTASNEKKASKVLGIIFAVFVILWTPFFTMNIISVVCESCMEAITPSMMASIVWLGYMSSLANPIIYTMFNTSFRRAFYRILACQYPKYNAAQAQDNILMTNASNWGSDRRNTLTLTLREY